MRGGSGGPGVYQEGAIQNCLAGWSEYTPHMKMHWSLPHLKKKTTKKKPSLRTTQPWDDHNTPEHWSQHGVRISQASMHCKANPGFVVKNWRVVNVRPRGVVNVIFFCLACWLCSPFNCLSWCSLSILLSFHLKCFSVQQGGCFSKQEMVCWLSIFKRWILKN